MGEKKAPQDTCVLVTGGCGFIGSHTVVALLEDGLSVYVTAPSASWDYVARAFWPKIGIPEDPVCGSMQSALVPYWSERLGKRELVCRQTSARGGTVWCEDTGDAVLISGTGALYLQGHILGQ